MPFDIADFDQLTNREFLEALVDSLNVLETGSGGGGLELINTLEVVGAAVDSLSFSGLDGDVDDSYLLIGRWVKPTFSISFLVLEPNGEAANTISPILQLSTWSRVEGAGSVTRVSQSALVVSEGRNSPIVNSMEMRLEARTGSIRTFTTKSAQITPNASLLQSQFRAQQGAGVWNDSTANITSLDLRVITSPGNPIAAEIGVGSRFSLYRFLR